MTPPPPRTHCRRGHEMTPENTYIFGGKRICRACRRKGERERYQPRPRPDSPVTGMTQNEKWAYYRRQRYWAKRGVPPPEKVEARYRDGMPCHVCHQPIRPEDKHSNYLAHKWCKKGHAFKDGEPCKLCSLPVAMAEKHCREKAHAACVEKRKSAAKAPRAVVAKAPKERAMKPKAMKVVEHWEHKFEVEPPPAPVVVPDGVEVKRVPAEFAWSRWAE